MELPHLTLFIRRMWRTPGRATVAFLVGWLALVMLVQLYPDLNFPFFSWQASDRDLLNSYTAILLLGHFALFYVVAVGMRAVLDDVRGGFWGWHVAPISNSCVLAGSLLSTLGSSIVPLAGLLAFAPLAALSAVPSNMYPNGQLGMDMFNFHVFALYFPLRLVNFALLSACFQLAFRRTALADFASLLLAVAATMASLWQGRLVYDQDMLSLLSIRSWWLVGLCGLALIIWLMLLSSRSDGLRIQHVVLLFFVILLPIVLGAASLVADIVSPRYISFPFFPQVGIAADMAYNNGAFVPHIVLANVYPNLEAAWSGHFGRHRMSPSILVLLGHLMAAISLWVGALICLDMVRRPQKYLSWRPWRRRSTAAGAGQP